MIYLRHKHTHNNTTKMDATDKKLLELMQIDSKKTTKELSGKLNLSVTAVYERIKKLEREVIISKYATILDKTKITIITTITVITTTT